MIDVEIFYQYEAVSILKSEVRTYTNSKYNTFIFTIENENNYHVNNVQIFVTFNLINQPLENLTTITPENYKIIEVNNKISQISFDFFEIRIKEAFELNIKFSEIIHGCSDPKALQYFSEKDSAYLTATWIVLFVFLILIMLILYCGEITNLNKKKK